MPIKNLIFPILNSQSEYSAIKTLPVGNSIPKIIHQTYSTKSASKTLSEGIAKNVEKIKLMNPTWEYRLYDDADVHNFIALNYGSDVLSYFEKINNSYGAAKADLFRYLLLYKCGGVYLDIKATLERPLDEVLHPEDTFILSHWADDNAPRYSGWGVHSEMKDYPLGELQQWHIACAPGHPFLKAVIDAVLRNLDLYDPYLHGVGKIGVLRLTGPIAYTLAIMPIIHLYNNRLIRSYSDAGFVYSFFEKTDDHAKIFPTHYLRQNHSIVNQNRYKKFALFWARICRKIWLLAHKDH